MKRKSTETDKQIEFQGIATDYELATVIAGLRKAARDARHNGFAQRADIMTQFQSLLNRVRCNGKENDAHY